MASKQAFDSQQAASKATMGFEGLLGIGGATWVKATAIP